MCGDEPGESTSEAEDSRFTVCRPASTRDKPPSAVLEVSNFVQNVPPLADGFNSKQNR
jgi:hypothetical protein